MHPFRINSLYDNFISPAFFEQAYGPFVTMQEKITVFFYIQLFYYRMFNKIELHCDRSGITYFCRSCLPRINNFMILIVSRKIVAYLIERRTSLFDIYVRIFGHFPHELYYFEDDNNNRFVQCYPQPLLLDYNENHFHRRRDFIFTFNGVEIGEELLEDFELRMARRRFILSYDWELYYRTFLYILYKKYFI